MHLVALVDAGDQLELKHPARVDPASRFHLHRVAGGQMNELLRSLKRLEFAGAVLLGEGTQIEAQAAADRSSLEASELGAADTLTVTPAGIVADHNLGRALAAALESRRWDAGGAAAVVLGANREARAAARELLRLGVKSLALLAKDRVSAEGALPQAAGAQVTGRAYQDPLALTLIERADVIVRSDPNLLVPDEAIGPHLAILEFAPGATDLLRRGVELGALTLNRSEIELHRLALSLRQILGGPVNVSSLRSLLGP